MKRFIGIALCVIVLMSMMAVPVQASIYSDFEYGNDVMWDQRDSRYYKTYGEIFAGKNIEKIEFSDNVRYIPEGHFEGCTELCEIYLSDHVQRIGKNAFKGTAYYSDSGNWDNGVLYIGNCLIKANPNQMGAVYTVKDDTRLIADGAFEGCKDLKIINIPDTVQYIGKNAFYGTAFYNTAENWKDGFLYSGEYLIEVSAEEAARKILLSEDTRGIADGAFEGCENIVSVVFSNSVKFIGNNVFCGCTKLESVSFGKGIKELGFEAFNDCPSLSKFTVDTANEHFVVNGGILYDKEQTRLIKCPSKLEGCPVIPETVTEVEPYAFKGCGMVDYVTLPADCQYVGEYAFADCDSMKSVVFGDKMHIVGNYAFFDCDELEKVVINSEYFECLGIHAFDSCDKLCDVSIFTRKLQAIREGTFKDCISLANVDIFFAPEVAADAFEGSGVITDESFWENGMLIVGGNYLLKVAEGTTDCFIPYGVYAVADGAFDETLDTLTCVRVPASIKGFRDAAFRCLGYNTLVRYEGTINSFISKTDFDYDLIALTVDKLEINALLAFLLFVLAMGVIGLLFWYDDKTTTRKLLEEREAERAQKKADGDSIEDKKIGSVLKTEDIGSKKETDADCDGSENKGGN